MHPCLLLSMYNKYKWGVFHFSMFLHLLPYLWALHRNEKTGGNEPLQTRTFPVLPRIFLSTKFFFLSHNRSLCFDNKTELESLLFIINLCLLCQMVTENDGRKQKREGLSESHLGKTHQLPAMLSHAWCCFKNSVENGIKDDPILV